MNLHALAADVCTLRKRLDPESYEGFLVRKIAYWTLDALAESHPTAAELAPAIGVTLALMMADRWKDRDMEVLGL